MAIPDYQTFMLPLLKLASDGQMHSMRDAFDALADEFALTEAERKDLLPSGRQPTFENRVGWAKTYLKKAGLVDSPKRGFFQVTQAGLDVLKQAPPRIDRAFLMQFPAFVTFQAPRQKLQEQADDQEIDEQTPEEGIESAYQRVREELATELLQTVKSCSPAFFERLVIDLLVKMGYGGTRRDAGQALGRSGDSGIDGIIKEDRLGLDVIYIQAKRWENTVGRPLIQQFAGALQGQRARRGIFITTSAFSQAAWDYVSRVETRIVLIDGETLAQLMIDFGIGVSTIATYELKRVDSDYFVEE
jgi:restriction system protein